MLQLGGENPDMHSGGWDGCCFSLRTLKDALSHHEGTIGYPGGKVFAFV